MEYNKFSFFFQAEDGIRDSSVTGVQTCALPIWRHVVYSGLGHQSFGAAIMLSTGASLSMDRLSPSFSTEPAATFKRGTATSSCFFVAFLGPLPALTISKF